MNWKEPSLAYVQSLKLHYLLHQLARMGLFESPLAEECRDSMDKPWFEMSAVEQEHIRDFAANMNILEDALKKE